MLVDITRIGITQKKVSQGGASMKMERILVLGIGEGTVSWMMTLGG